MRMTRRNRLLILCTALAVLFIFLSMAMVSVATNRKRLLPKVRLVPKVDLTGIKQSNIAEKMFTRQKFFLGRETTRKRQSYQRETTNTENTEISTTKKMLKQREITTIKKLAKQRSTDQIIQKEITKECKPNFDPTNIQTPFKFYIYDLPPDFNSDIVNCIKKHIPCYNLEYCGMGEELFRYDGQKLSHASGEALHFSQFLQSQQNRQMTQQSGNQTSGGLNSLPTYSISIRNTHMFSLEVIMHYKLLHSPYRTLNPTRADMFYIPFYSGLMCECNRPNAPELIKKFFSYLNSLPYFKAGKPHFSTIAKIQREQTSQLCSTLRQPESSNITFIAIEKESNPMWHTIVPYVFGKSILVAPYPAYIHFIDNTVGKSKLSELERKTANPNETPFHLNVPSLEERNVFLFLGCGTRRSNGFRALIIDQFAIQTNDDYGEYLKGQKTNSNIDQIMLITNECSVKHRYSTIPWMMRSIFCLQPPGDSPTRKSFYDSVLSGCIPVTFKLKYPTELPFSDKLNYDNFTFTIDEKLISEYNKTVLEIVKTIPQERIKFMHRNLLQVAKWFQYSVPDGGPQYDDDAITMILDQLKRMFKI